MSSGFGQLNQVQKLLGTDNVDPDVSAMRSEASSLNDRSKSFEKLQQASQLISQIFAELELMKKHEVEFCQKKFKKPIQQQRLQIVACLCACHRRRMIVKYNHEKKLEIKRF